MCTREIILSILYSTQLVVNNILKKKIKNHIITINKLYYNCIFINYYTLFIDSQHKDNETLSIAVLLPT